MIKTSQNEYILLLFFNVYVFLIIAVGFATDLTTKSYDHPFVYSLLVAISVFAILLTVASTIFCTISDHWDSSEDKDSRAFGVFAVIFLLMIGCIQLLIMIRNDSIEVKGATISPMVAPVVAFGVGELVLQCKWYPHVTLPIRAY